LSPPADDETDLMAVLGAGLPPDTGKPRRAIQHQRGRGVAAENGL